MASGPLHRTVSNIRTGGNHSPAAQSGPTSPHTPLRTASSVFGSPSSLRADEDTIIIELGARRLRVGFAGDAVHKATVDFGPEQQRRVGDLRAWQTGYLEDWRKRAAGKAWGSDYELWSFDIRGQDLGLVGDKIERGLRDTFAKYLLIDSRPRRVVLVLPSSLPVPLLSTTLDTIFNRFQSPTISLVSAPVMTAAAAGVRAALVVDLGWAETVVTSVYEYREVLSSRSTRGGKSLLDNIRRLLSRAVSEKQGKPAEGGDSGDFEDYAVSFEECEDVASRLSWCRPSTNPTPEKPSADGLPTVAETDESELADVGRPRMPDAVEIPLQSTIPPTTVTIPYNQLAEAVETTFLDTQYAPTSWDDHELPLHLLLYRHLLSLPLDVRAICMARIIFTGGCANVLGLRGRLFDELSHLVRTRGWDPISGKAVEQYKANPKLRGGGGGGGRGTRSSAAASSQLDTGGGGGEQDGVWHDAANATPQRDPVEEQVRRQQQQQRQDDELRVQGELRAIESLGAWAGASLLTQLKVPAIATIDRELWLQQGAAGASRAVEVDLKAQQRQSLGPGGLMRSAAAGTTWTLGLWGSS